MANPQGQQGLGRHWLAVTQEQPSIRSVLVSLQSSGVVPVWWSIQGLGTSEVGSYHWRLCFCLDPVPIIHRIMPPLCLNRTCEATCCRDGLFTNAGHPRTAAAKEKESLLRVFCSLGTPLPKAVVELIAAEYLEDAAWIIDPYR